MIIDIELQSRPPRYIRRVSNMSTVDKWTRLACIDAARKLPYYSLFLSPDKKSRTYSSEEKNRDTSETLNAGNLEVIARNSLSFKSSHMPVMLSFMIILSMPCRIAIALILQLCPVTSSLSLITNFPPKLRKL